MIKKFIFSACILVLLISAEFLLSRWINAYHYQLLLNIGINAILAVSLNLLNGFTGQFSLGHAGFMAIGAYASAAITYYGGPLLEPWLGTALLARLILFIFALLWAMGLAGLAGLLVGIPTLRLRGDYLAVATLGFGEIIRVVILNLDFVGGARGFSVLVEHELRSLAIIMGFLVLTVIVIGRIVYSPYGYGFRAIHNDELAANVLGIHTTRLKTSAFVISAVFAGLAGFLFAHSQGYVHTNSFTFLKSFEIVAMVILGGMGSITGSILAATLLTLLPEWLRGLPEAVRQFGEFRMVIYALLLIVLMRFRPQGLLGFREWNWDSITQGIRMIKRIGVKT